MSMKSWRIVRPTALFIFLLLVVLSLTTAPVAAQSTSCTDASVMGFNDQAPSGTTFTMTKDCTITKSGASIINTLHIRNKKTFIIDGAGYTINAADKAQVNDRGTVFNFDGGSDITLLLRNLTITGGGDAATPTGGDADPAIVVRNGNLILDGVTIQNTRGGAIRIINSGKVILKNSTFTGNQVSGATTVNQGTVITVYSGGRLFLQGLFTAKNNTGGQSAIFLRNGGAIDIYDLGCLDLAGNTDADGTQASFYQLPSVPISFRTLWGNKPLKTERNCGASTASTTTRPQMDPTPPTIPTSTSTPTPAAPSNGGSGADGNGGQTSMALGAEDEMDMKMAMADSNYNRRIKGTLGSDRSAYYLTNSGGVLVLQIYRVDGDSVGHWVMNVSQAAIDALGGAGCVAASPDGRYALRVWADGNITISAGPDRESKVFHNTLKGGVNGPVIATQTTYSNTPPGVGCPGYLG